MQELSLTTVGERGSALFDQLYSILGQYPKREFVAIDVESGDWAVGRSTSVAMREVLRRHPDAQLFLRRIGDEPEPELAARIFATDVGSDK